MESGLAYLRVGRPMESSEVQSTWRASGVCTYRVCMSGVFTYSHILGGVGQWNLA